MEKIIELYLADHQPGKSSYLYREAESDRDHPVLGSFTVARDAFSDDHMPRRLIVKISVPE